MMSEIFAWPHPAHPPEPLARRLRFASERQTDRLLGYRVTLQYKPRSYKVRSAAKWKEHSLLISKTFATWHFHDDPTRGEFPLIFVFVFVPRHKAQ
jgi:hypothetical protein